MKKLNTGNNTVAGPSHLLLSIIEPIEDKLNPWLYSMLYVLDLKKPLTIARPL
jgi:hypothetical protein